MKKLKLTRKIGFCLGMIGCVLLCSCSKDMKQYNSNGISVRPCITIDESVQEELVCEVSGSKVYTVNLKDIYFIDTQANQVELKDALEENVLTMEDVLEVCEKQESEGKNLYLGENYKIIQSENTYLFAPLDYEE